MRTFALVACLAVLGGCAMRAPLARVAIEHNELVAETTNQMMLANIVRAKNREPMHFTSLSALHGNVTLTAAAGVGGTFAGDTVTRTHSGLGAFSGDTVAIPGSSVTPSLSGTVTTSPSFDLAVNDSQEFYQGFLRPIEPDIVAHYLDDGWPPELITYLLVRRFDFVAKGTILRGGTEILKGSAEKRWEEDKKKNRAMTPALVEKGETIGSLINDADPGSSPDQARRFGQVSSFIRCFRLATASKAGEDRDLFSVGRLSDLSGLDKVDGATLDARLKADGSSTLFRVGGSSTGLRLVDRVTSAAKNGADVDPLTTTSHEAQAALAACAPFDRSPAGRSAASASARARAVGRISPPDPDQSNVPFKTFIGPDHQAWQVSDKRHSDDDDARPGISGRYFIPDPNRRGSMIDVPVDVTMTLRSPEALIYFLGEYIRYPEALRFKTDVGQPAGLCQGSQPFLIVKEDDRSRTALLSVRIDGHVYSIPDMAKACNGRSMQVLGFVEQLYNLHKSSKDKLGTQSVHLIP